MTGTLAIPRLGARGNRSYKQLNTIARACYLNGAQKLEGKVNPELLIKMGMQAVNTGLSGGKILENWRYQIDAEKAQDTPMTLGIVFSDTDESYTVELRNSVLDIRKEKAGAKSPGISLTSAQLNAIISGEPAPDGVGDIAVLNRLLGYLDQDQAGFYMHLRRSPVFVPVAAPGQGSALRRAARAVSAPVDGARRQFRQGHPCQAGCHSFLTL